MNVLVPLIYNNYGRRTMKWEGRSWHDYELYRCGEPTKPVNFVPGDGITTTAIINAAHYTLNSSPDYLLVADDTDGRIKSRWFVLSMKRTSNGQYRLSLRRDVLIDFSAAYLDHNLYIRRGHLKESDPAIFNDEGLHFNRIKKSETLLKDFTGCPWLVAYISPDVAKDHMVTVTDDDGKATSEEKEKTVLEGTIEGFATEHYASWDEVPYNKYFNSPYVRSKGAGTRIEFPVNFTPNGWKIKNGAIELPLSITENIAYHETTNENDFFPSEKHPLDLGRHTGNEYASTLQANATAFKYVGSWTDARRGSVADELTKSPGYTILSADEFDQLQSLNGNIIQVGSQTYQLKLTSELKKFRDGTQMSDTLRQEICNVNVNNSETPTSSGLYLNAQSTYSGDDIFAPEDLVWVGYVYTFSYSPVQSVTFTYDFTDKNLSNGETPYGILCMPYEDNYHMVGADGTTKETRLLSKQNRLKIFQALGAIGGLVYDIQILPYCPLTEEQLEYDAASDTFSPVSSQINVVEVHEKKEDGTVGAFLTSMYVAPQANRSFTIERLIVIPDIHESVQTDLFRLCSPNFASTFEFSPAKFFDGQDHGVIPYFDVDMCCRPFTPYIHVNPRFSGLYGKDFHDARGLICSGDFSVDRISDAWETYQYNNKNWEASFNRQIDTMEYNRKWGLADNIINGGFGAIGHAAAGALLGGPAGAVAAGGAAVGEGIYNSIQDWQMSGRNIADTKAQFAFNNENIQAQPYSIQKVGALNNNNKLFPVLEYYTCTDREKTLYENYIKAYQFAVGRVDNFLKGEYVVAGQPTFVQAKLMNDVKFNDGCADAYNAVNYELSTGVYILVPRLSELGDLAQGAAEYGGNY